MRSKKFRWLSDSPRHCIYCGRVGPRVVVLGGWAHRRCIPSNVDYTSKPRAPDAKEGE